MGSPMTWIAQRSSAKKAIECVCAARFASAHGAPVANIRPLRHAWLYGRFNLLPRGFDLSSGLVVDVGANRGDWTAAALRLAPRAKVLAIEPSPSLVATLRDRFAGEPGVRVVGQALSDREGEVVLHVTSNSHLTSLLIPRDMNQAYGVSAGWEVVAEINVPGTTLDALLAGSVAPSLVKIDVQGAEPLVLAGAKNALTSARAVLIEMAQQSHYEGDVPSSDLDLQMRRLGYRIAGRSDPWLDIQTGATLWYDACYLNSRFDT